jgi:serine/threonine protein kinase
MTGEDTFIDSFQRDKSSFEHQPGLLAIKVAHLSKDIDCAKVLEDLAHEGDMAENLEHINVCKLVTKYCSPQIVLLAYEYCSKGSLCSIICDDTKSFDYLPLALDIAQGMAYLHSKNFIHLDLKPSNIFVDRNNRAKIADFGMCTVYAGEPLRGETGTYRWMAPEIIRHEPYSTKADVYSFGICLWQLVTRSIQPFGDMNAVQAAYAVAKGERPFIPFNTPDFIRQIITACWDDDQLKRPTFTNIYLGLSAYSNISCQQQDYSI